MSLGKHAHTQGLKKHFDDYQLFANGARDNLGIKISLNLYPLYDSSISFFHGPPQKMIMGTFPLPVKHVHGHRKYIENHRSAGFYMGTPTLWSEGLRLVKKKWLWNPGSSH